jgi:hypothetical protein
MHVSYYCFFNLDTRDRQSVRSTDYSIRSSKDIGRNRHADLLCGLKIDHQLKFRRLLYRQIGGLGSLQDSVLGDKDCVSVS